MINLYEKLGVLPDAPSADIQAAITKAAQTESLPLEILQKANKWLLNEQVRKQYNAKLFAEHPEILQEMFAAARAKAQPSPQPPSEPQPTTTTKIKIKRADNHIAAQKSNSNTSIDMVKWQKRYDAVQRKKSGGSFLSTTSGIFFGSWMLVLLPIILLFGSCNGSDKQTREKEEISSKEKLETIQPVQPVQRQELPPPPVTVPVTPIQSQITPEEQIEEYRRRSRYNNRTQEESETYSYQYNDHSSSYTPSRSKKRSRRRRR